MSGQSQSTVLIVDDEPLTCDMLAGFLAPDRYNIIFAYNGPETLKQVKTHVPDVILLDVMMPGVDGFEVCQQLKSDKQWRHIPIILVTALSGTENLVHGLDVGADDFINKPVDRFELRARVRSLLRIKKQYDELDITLRMRENLTHIIVHDLRTPLTDILGYTQLLLTRNTLSVTDAKDIQAIQSQAYRLDGFLNDMLILAKLEAEHPILNRSMVDVSQVIQQVKESYNIVAISKNIKLTTDLPSSTHHILLDANLFQRALENIISNAIKFSPRESTVALQVEYLQTNTTLLSAGRQVRIKIIDQGPGIKAEDRDRIFNKFEIGKLKGSRDPQIGLGLAFCKMVIEAHQGHIFVEPNKNRGSIFTIEI